MEVRFVLIEIGTHCGRDAAVGEGRDLPRVISRHEGLGWCGWG